MIIKNWNIEKSRITYYGHDVKNRFSTVSVKKNRVHTIEV